MTYLQLTILIGEVNIPEKQFGRFGAFWFRTFVMLFRATRARVLPRPLVARKS